MDQNDCSASVERKFNAGDNAHDEVINVVLMTCTIPVLINADDSG